MTSVVRLPSRHGNPRHPAVRGPDPAHRRRPGHRLRQAAAQPGQGPDRDARRRTGRGAPPAPERPAPQIGVGLRVFAYAVGDERGHLVNPVLDFPDAEEQDGEEGCLSFPGVYYDVKRRLNTVARGYTDRGDPVQIAGTRVLARCLQHEADHLEGGLFIDRMDAATRKRAMREIRESNWDGPVKISPHRMTDRIF